MWPCLYEPQLCSYNAIISDSSCYLKKFNKPQTYLALETKH